MPLLITAQGLIEDDRQFADLRDGTWRAISNPDTGKYRLLQLRQRAIRAKGGRVYPQPRPFPADGLADAVLKAEALLVEMGVGLAESGQAASSASTSRCFSRSRATSSSSTSSKAFSRPQ